MRFKLLPGLNAENTFFYFCLAFTVGILLFGGTFPTLDGPSHTYNAELAKYLFTGNDFIRSYLSISLKPSPNYTDHYLLAILLKLVPFEWAGKLLQITYVIAFPVMFRKLVKNFSPVNIGMSILAIPYSFTMLYYLGFYNFCLSFPLLFGIILFYDKHIANESGKVPVRQYIKLSLLTIMLYFTNGLGFLYGGLVIGLFEARNIYLLLKNRSENDSKRVAGRRVLLFISTWIPGLIMFTAFMITTPQYAEGENHSFSDLFQSLLQSRLLMVYNGFEYKCIRWISYAVGLAMAGALVYALRNKFSHRFSKVTIFLVIAMVSALLYFTVPDSLSVGMMSIRLNIFFFMFFLLWLAMQKNYRLITWVVGIAVMCVHFILMFNYRMPVQNDMQERSEYVKATGDYIQPNSVVLDINLTENWIYGHFGDYLAVNKPLIIVPNYEADDGWFGVLWKSDMPQIIYNNKDHIDSLYSLPGPPDYKATKEIDYVFVHGDFSKIVTEPKWAAVKEGLLARYIPAYTSSDSSIHLYQLKGISTELLPK